MSGLKQKAFIKRYIAVAVLCALCMLMMGGRLVDLQIIHGEEYRSQTEKKVFRTTVVQAPRGEILDRYGRPLVTNRMGFTVQIDKMTMGDNNLNDLILSLARLFDERGEKYTDSLPVGNPPFAFTCDMQNPEDPDAKEILKIMEDRDLPESATADDVIRALKDYYKVGDSYGDAELRKIIGVRYEMENRGFSATAPFTMAQDVSIETVTYIEENGTMFRGAEISVNSIREYVSASTASHVLGRISNIYKGDYEELKEKGYAMNDTVGRDGAEKAFESYLRGTNGAKTVEQAVSGGITNITGTQEAVPGNNVILTLDKNLQEVAEKSLAEVIAKISEDGKKNNKAGWDASAGAVVVQDVRNGDILALANYPTYDLSTFTQDYQRLSQDTNKPLFNRAISGAYAPGSTFKMVTALAGLETGVINTNTIITCTGIYRYYADANFTPRCWIYNDYGISHGPLNVEKAIEKSCNYFFYEVGRLVGIDSLNYYAGQLGLGEYTGIEIAGEAKGILAGREYRDRYNQPWYDGETIIAAIGQSDNAFTPLQLCSYIATLANGGTRYEAHLLKSVKDYRTGESVYEQEPVALSKIEMDSVSYNAIIRGMQKVTEDGTASNVFSDYPVKVGGKTGSADVGTGSANGIFVAFAPLENPEIAISIVVEHGAHGNYVATVARDIFDAYFSRNAEWETLPAEGEIVS